MMATSLLSVAAPASVRQHTLDFLYLDLEQCTRCRGTLANLDAALAIVGDLLTAAGVSLSVTKQRVESAAQAHALRFVSSPTIRVDGQDIALELRESRCETCEAVACNGGTVECRVWVFQGVEHTEAPTMLIVDAILSAVYSGQERRAAEPDADGVPANLQRFFEDTARLSASSQASCCSPDAAATCCEPSAKSACCGTSTSGGCGCQAGAQGAA